jgi:hypothetical protein
MRNDTRGVSTDLISLSLSAIDVAKGEVALGGNGNCNCSPNANGTLSLRRRLIAY